MPGTLAFVKVKIQNKFIQREVYSVVLDDPEEKTIGGVSGHKEMQLVTDKAEWRYWVSKGKCAKPSSYDVMTEAGDIDLQPGDEVELLFKFLTLREVPVLPDH
jgi:hypothetical protein